MFSAEYYAQAVALLFANLAPFPDILRPVADANLLNANPSVLASHVIRTTVEESPELFYTLGCVAGIARMINLSIEENSFISRPARDAKELMKTTQPYADDDVI